MSFKRTLVLSFLLLLPSVVGAAATPKEVHKQMTLALASEAKAQEQYVKWTDEKISLSADIRDMKATDAWLEFQTEKYARYIKKQEAVIAELQRRKEEAKRIRMELEPFLETVVNTLEQFVASDLPFLAEERAMRIAFLRDSLDDYRLGLSEKLRRVFEALFIETEYGRNISATTTELNLNGVPTRVSVFRLGRTALFYHAVDGSTAGVWDRDTASWKELDAAFARTLRRAKDMADRKRAVELLDLPIGAAR